MKIGINIGIPEAVTPMNYGEQLKSRALLDGGTVEGYNCLEKIIRLLTNN